MNGALYLHEFLFGIYPYICLAVLFLGSLARFDREPFTWKSDSSQFLRTRELRLGSNRSTTAGSSWCWVILSAFSLPTHGSTGRSARLSTSCWRWSPAASPGRSPLSSFRSCCTGVSVIRVSPQQPQMRHRRGAVPVAPARARSRVRARFGPAHGRRDVHGPGRVCEGDRDLPL